MYRALLLGDSIRINYQEPVQEELRGIADVVFPAENCEHTLITLSRLDLWLEEAGSIDIVHWNNGLHDIGRNPGRSPIQIPLHDYVKNLELILSRLLGYCKNIIFATTTYVHPDAKQSSDEWSWRNEDIQKYNEASLEVMKKNYIPITRLDEVIKDNYDQLLSDDKIHLSKKGCVECAHAVSESIRTTLKAPGVYL